VRELAAVLLLLLAACRQQPEPVEARPKPELALLTSLPVLFAESFSLEPPDSPLRDALEARFALRAVDGPEQLKPEGLLLAIQPQAQTAERLVALDRWVRVGGRLVLLADPELEWESSRPLGDRFRPPFEYPDLGLLKHWGLSLERVAEGETGEAARRAAGTTLTPVSPGRLASSSPACRVEEAFVATCRLGRGFALVVADADFAMSGDPGDIAAVVALVESARRR
jgi:hypothetical protein